MKTSNNPVLVNTALTVFSVDHREHRFARNSFDMVTNVKMSDETDYSTIKDAFN